MSTPPCDLTDPDVEARAALWLEEQRRIRAGRYRAWLALRAPPGPRNCTYQRWWPLLAWLSERLDPGAPVDPETGEDPTIPFGPPGLIP